MDKVRGINGSLRCFRLGLASLVPVVGLAFAVLAAVETRRVRKAVGHEWNPARGYWLWGRALTALGLFISLITIGIVVVMVLYQRF